MPSFFPSDLGFYEFLVESSDEEFTKFFNDNFEVKVIKFANGMDFNGVWNTNDTDIFDKLFPCGDFLAHFLIRAKKDVLVDIKGFIDYSMSVKRYCLLVSLITGQEIVYQNKKLYVKTSSGSLLEFQKSRFRSTLYSIYSDFKFFINYNYEILLLKNSYFDYLDNEIIYNSSSFKNAIASYFSSNGNRLIHYYIPDDMDMYWHLEATNPVSYIVNNREDYMTYSKTYRDKYSSIYDLEW